MANDERMSEAQRTNTRSGHGDFFAVPHSDFFRHSSFPSPERGLSKCASVVKHEDMSRQELIEIVDRTSAEDRLFLQAYIEHLARVADSADGAELDQRLDAMRAGREVSLEEARRLHDALAAKGL
jgi:hypothetical protein